MRAVLPSVVVFVGIGRNNLCDAEGNESTVATGGWVGRTAVRLARSKPSPLYARSVGPHRQAVLLPIVLSLAAAVGWWWKVQCVVVAIMLQRRRGG